MTPHDEYDPELHGELEAPAAQPVMAAIIAIVIAMSLLGGAMWIIEAASWLKIPIR